MPNTYKDKLLNVDSTTVNSTLSTDNQQFLHVWSMEGVTQHQLIAYLKTMCLSSTTRSRKQALVMHHVSQQLYLLKNKVMESQRRKRKGRGSGSGRKGSGSGSDGENTSKRKSKKGKGNEKEVVSKIFH